MFELKNSTAEQCLTEVKDICFENIYSEEPKNKNSATSKVNRAFQINQC